MLMFPIVINIVFDILGIIMGIFSLFSLIQQFNFLLGYLVNSRSQHKLTCS